MICKRTALEREPPFQFREENGDLWLEGYFAVFGSECRITKTIAETIAPGAFDETLRTEDVRALTNHDSELVLGRMSAGTLVLRTDATGLWGQVKINRADQAAVNLYERVRRGDVNQCSFGFDILDESSDVLPDGTTLWTIRKVKLYEVSVVTFPAYEDTSVNARRRDQAELDRRRHEEWRARTTARLKGETHGTENPDAAPQH